MDLDNMSTGCKSPTKYIAIVVAILVMVEPNMSKEISTNVCSIELPSPEEPFDCPFVTEYPSIDIDGNGEAYITCGGDKYYFDEIKDRLKDGSRRINECKIHCCLLSYMGRLMNKCPESKQYACYQDYIDNTYTLVPLCGPPKIKRDCKCYQSQTTGCEDDNLSLCSNTNGVQCRHKTVTDGGANIICLCNKTRGDVSISTKCSKLSADAKTNQNVCTITVQSSEEPSDCGKASHYNYYEHIFEKNGKVYLECGGNNYTFGEIQEMLKNNDKIIDTCMDESYSKRRINCCILSYMGNLTNICQGSEQFACYTDKTADSYSLIPQCGAPKVKFGCKCYHSQIPICGEDQLSLCNYHLDAVQCRHDNVTGDKVNFRCICNTTQSTDDELLDCSESDTNSEYRSESDTDSTDDELLDCSESDTNSEYRSESDTDSGITACASVILGLCVALIGYTCIHYLQS